MDITIDPAVQSTFTQLGAYCVGRYPRSIIRYLNRRNNGLLVSNNYKYSSGRNEYIYFYF